MCGIIGYLGKRKAFEIILEGLSSLEYRGYDSFGILVFDSKKVFILKRVGRVRDLIKKIDDHEINGNCGVGHTRWATHGGVTKKNAHPHFDCHKKIFVVHNGIIENFAEIKRDLENKGHKFLSDTDSEVIAHLIEELSKSYDFKRAIIESLKLLKGTYALIIGYIRNPRFLVGAKKSSPLILGIGEGEFFLASDPNPILSYTEKFIFLDDYDVLFLQDNRVKIYSLNEEKIKQPKIEKLHRYSFDNQKGNYKHYMFKEIHEEPVAISRTLEGRIDFQKKQVVLKELERIKNKLKVMDKVKLIGCGTAYYACLYGKYLFEDILGLDVEAEIASEFRYRNYFYNPKILLITISQSGETIDTIEALKKAKNEGIMSLGIINVPGSTLTRLVDINLPTFAGPELAVASTKSLIAQMTVLFLLSVYLSQIKRIRIQREKLIYEFKDIPQKIEEIFKKKKEIEELADKLKTYKNFYFLGRKFEYFSALEGSLKLKEIAYLHSEAYPSGEMKHGPIALISDDFPVIIINPHNSLYEKTKSNLEEIRARKGKIILITDSQDDIEVFAKIQIPKTLEIFYPFLTVPLLHLLSYFVAQKLGREIDRPRNLAKSVTVE